MSKLNRTETDGCWRFVYLQGTTDCLEKNVTKFSSNPTLLDSIIFVALFSFLPKNKTIAGVIGE